MSCRLPQRLRNPVLLPGSYLRGVSLKEVPMNRLSAALVLAIGLSTAGLVAAAQDLAPPDKGSPYDSNPNCSDRNVSAQDPSCLLPSGETGARRIFNNSPNSMAVNPATSSNQPTTPSTSTTAPSTGTSTSTISPPGGSGSSFRGGAPVR